MVTREQLSENRVFDRTRPEYKESAIIALSEGLITDFSDSLGGGGYKNYLIETKIATISPKRLCSKWYCRNI